MDLQRYLHIQVHVRNAFPLVLILSQGLLKLDGVWRILTLLAHYSIYFSLYSMHKKPIEYTIKSILWNPAFYRWSKPFGILYFRGNYPFLSLRYPHSDKIGFCLFHFAATRKSCWNSNASFCYLSIFRFWPLFAIFKSFLKQQASL